MIAENHFFEGRAQDFCSLAITLKQEVVPSNSSEKICQDVSRFLMKQL